MLVGTLPDDDVALVQIRGGARAEARRSLGQLGACPVGDEVVAVGSADPTSGPPTAVDRGSSCRPRTARSRPDRHARAT